MIVPKQSYHEGETETLVVFDVRAPSAVERLHSERAAWGECSDIEALDQHHFVLIIRPGGTRELAA